MTKYRFGSVVDIFKRHPDDEIMFGRRLKQKSETAFQFTCPGVESGADLWWSHPTFAPLVLWAYPSGLALLAS